MKAEDLLERQRIKIPAGLGCYVSFNAGASMPKIEIETCSKTPNYCALEAVAKFIRNNYTQRLHRSYQHKQLITVESGRKLFVKETPMGVNAKPTCDCKFSVSVEET